MSSISFQDVQKNILTMHQNDCIRDGKIVQTGNFLIKIYQVIKDFFSGGRVLMQNREFDNISPLLHREVTDLQTLLNTDNSHQAFTSQQAQLLNVASRVQNILKISSKMKVSKWHHDLEDNQNYRSFKAQTKILKDLARRKFREFEGMAESSSLRNNPHFQELKRWIFADSFQRGYAVINPTGQLPYRAEEIPRGAILLTNCDSYSRGLEVRHFNPSLWQKFKQFQASVVRWVTGHPLIHAEIALGDGRVFHISKEDDQTCTGQGTIEDRNPIWNEKKNKFVPNYYHKYEILLPNEEEFLKEYNQSVSQEQQAATFHELQEKILTYIEQNGERVKANGLAILSMILRTARKENYDASEALNFEETYSCSGCLSAFFAKFHIDIGKDFDLEAHRVSPTEFFYSRFFTKFYSAIEKI
ncbi:MAG: hypothetical protein Tsb0015_01600 [Simkaniaceae bacterium]